MKAVLALLLPPDDPEPIPEPPPGPVGRARLLGFFGPGLPARTPGRSSPRPFKVVRAKYAPVEAGGLDRTRAAVRYIARRPGAGRTEEREAFDDREERVSRSEVEERLERWAAEHPHGYFYRLVFNPGEGHGHDPQTLRAWARDVMASLQEQHPEVEWVGWLHTDHSAHDHVHVVAILDDKLEREYLAALRYEAGQAWKDRSREPRREAARDRRDERSKSLEWE